LTDNGRLRVIANGHFALMGQIGRFCSEFSAMQSSCAVIAALGRTRWSTGGIVGACRRRAIERSSDVKRKPHGVVSAGLRFTFTVAKRL
jgi:hypothetical protein